MIFEKVEVTLSDTAKSYLEALQKRGAKITEEEVLRKIAEQGFTVGDTGIQMFLLSEEMLNEVKD